MIHGTYLMALCYAVRALFIALSLMTLSPALIPARRDT